jgi:hypothetical protein
MLNELRIWLKTRQYPNATRTRQNATLFEGDSTGIFGHFNFTSYFACNFIPTFGATAKRTLTSLPLLTDT